MPIDFSKRFRVVAHEDIQLSQAERQLIAVMGDKALSIREIGAEAKLSIMAVYNAIEKLTKKQVVCELETFKAKAA